MATSATCRRACGRNDVTAELSRALPTLPDAAPHPIDPPELLAANLTTLSITRHNNTKIDRSSDILKTNTYLGL